MVTEGQYLVKSNHAPNFASAGTANSTNIQWKTKSFANHATHPPPGGTIAWAAAITLTRAEEIQYVMTHCQRFAGSLSHPKAPWMRPDTFYQFKPIHCIDFCSLITPSDPFINYNHIHITWSIHRLHYVTY